MALEPLNSGISKVSTFNKKKGQKNQRAKKQKRLEGSSSSILKDMELLETPIQVVQEGKEWALVVSTNKPPETI